MFVLTCSRQEAAASSATHDVRHHTRDAVHVKMCANLSRAHRNVIEVRWLHRVFQEDGVLPLCAGTHVHRGLRHVGRTGADRDRCAKETKSACPSVTIRRLCAFEAWARPMPTTVRSLSASGYTHSVPWPYFTFSHQHWLTSSQHPRFRAMCWSTVNACGWA